MKYGLRFIAFYFLSRAIWYGMRTYRSEINNLSDMDGEESLRWMENELEFTKQGFPNFEKLSIKLGVEAYEIYGYWIAYQRLWLMFNNVGGYWDRELKSYEYSPYTPAGS